MLSLSLDNDQLPKGFEKGISWKSVVPLKKIIFVQSEENSYLDDYGYLAAVPTAVFYDRETKKIYSNPLLFYQEKYAIKNDKERSLDSYSGIEYFMEDWSTYCNGNIDQITTINVPKNTFPREWKGLDFHEITGNTPYEISCNLALDEWRYSDEAVVAVIDDTFEKPENITSGKITGNLPIHDTGKLYFELEQPIVGSGGRYISFNIDNEQYKYVLAKIQWPNNADLDLQLFDDNLGLVDASAHWSPLAPAPEEVAASYIHDYGKWEIGITIMPKKSLDYSPGTMEDMFPDTAIYSNMLFQQFNKKIVKVDVLLYPGIDLPLKHPSPFGCRNATFTLTWDDPDAQLGFTLLDPAGTEICSSLTKTQIVTGDMDGETTQASLRVEKLGECKSPESYHISIFSLNNVTKSVPFSLEYTWQQNFSKYQGECLTSASNGAVLASILNAPLIYTSPSTLPQCTQDTLYKLGVKKIYLINIGNHVTQSTRDKLEKIADISNDHQDLYTIYHAITDITKNKDSIFTTIDPWTYWYAEDLKPAGQKNKTLFIGPASYLAAHHGSPVLIVDMHPQLSQAIVYHTDYWQKYSGNRGFGNEPSGGSMTQSGRQVYEFLSDHGLGDLEEGIGQNRETIITVAGQYDIGISWDRTFTGAAYPGRFWGSPVDTSYSISRNVFYPALIFVNPGMNQISLINGSTSEVKRISGRLRDPWGVNLVTTRQSQEEKFIYPVLQTYDVYLHKFNERGDGQWGFVYTRADGIIPWITDSQDPIDDGVTGDPGAFYPDISDTEVIPFYAKRAGYENVFTTNFSATVENLNRGVLIWVSNCHGDYHSSGTLAMWDPHNPYVYETNPWRAYESILLNPGNIREFIHWIPHVISEYVELTDAQIEILKKIAAFQPIKWHFLSERGSTENPDVALINPQLTRINKVLSVLTGGMFEIWSAFGFQLHRERLLHPITSLQNGLPFITTYDGKVMVVFMSGADTALTSISGYEFDDALGNLHSCGLHSISCLTACTYMHLVWLRHGMTYQIIDPWVTSDYSSVWQQLLIKRLALGDSIGEAYERGMRAVGPGYLTGQWWWDKWENVVLFGDPDLHVFVPGTNYSDANNWEKKDTIPLGSVQDPFISFGGHAPFGATEYPHERSPFPYHFIQLVISIVIIGIFLTLLFILVRKKKVND